MTTRDNIPANTGLLLVDAVASCTPCPCHLLWRYNQDDAFGVGDSLEGLQDLMRYLRWDYEELNKLLGDYIYTYLHAAFMYPDDAHTPLINRHNRFTNVLALINEAGAAAFPNWSPLIQQDITLTFGDSAYQSFMQSCVQMIEQELGLTAQAYQGLGDVVFSTRDEMLGNPICQLIDFVRRDLRTFMIAMGYNEPYRQVPDDYPFNWRCGGSDEADGDYGSLTPHQSFGNDPQNAGADVYVEFRWDWIVNTIVTSEWPTLGINEMDDGLYQFLSNPQLDFTPSERELVQGLIADHNSAEAANREINLRIQGEIVEATATERHRRAHQIFGNDYDQETDDPLYYLACIYGPGDIGALEAALDENRQMYYNKYMVARLYFREIRRDDAWSRLPTPIDLRAWEGLTLEGAEGDIRALGAVARARPAMAGDDDFNTYAVLFIVAIIVANQFLR